MTRSKKPSSPNKGAKAPGSQKRKAGARAPSDIQLSAEDRTTQPATKSKRATKGKGARKTSARKTKAAKSSKPNILFRAIRFLVYWGVILGIWGGIAAAGIVAYYGAQLPQSTDWQIPNRPPNVQILSHDGGLIANRGKTGGQEVRLSSLPPYLPDAVVAIEDHRFYSHFGFDPIGFTRAMVTNVIKGRLAQGGSTLTQQ
ncbi:MAG TPA: penicillin-binding protein, partial [Rhizobiales bacterium]|nr:penicillin-binding protein [Hyphomicrobiales bacterium]